jgi:dipeptidyl aminopeptidase/acylaminoacyl peptidase
MKKLFTGLVIIIIFTFCSLWGKQKEAKEKKIPEFKDIINLKSPGGSKISPDGNYILYGVNQPDWEKNKYISQIWMADTRTKEIKQMTFNKNSSYFYSWSPDNRFISFVSDRGDKTQLFIMSVTGGEGRQITKLKTRFNRYSWSPDSQSIAYAAPDEKSKKQKSMEKKYGGFEIIDLELNPSHLWVLDIASGKTEKLVDRDDLHIDSFNWSPDGKQIAFSARPDSRILSFSKSDLYVLDVAGKKIKKLVDQKGPDSSPIWSPDGKTIAFTSNMGTETYFVNTEICTIPAAGGPITCLTKSFDEDARLLAWKDDGIYFSALQGMTSHLFRLNPLKKTVKQITSGDFMIRGASLTKQGKEIAFTLRNKALYPELYYSKIKKFKPIKLTNFSSQIKDWTLSTKETISWRSTDGAEITGVLIKPADFNPKKKYPLFVIIHGGPTGISYPQKIDGYNRVYPIEQWAAKGVVFLEPNYRGSAGFGSDFRRLNYRNLGVGDYWDVISGVDHLIKLGFVDKERVASMGWSQGGYISAYITTYSDRFKAVSVGAGISDWVTYYYRTDITPFTIHYLGATPWDDPMVYKKTSPMTYINKAKTPTLIQHGEFDRRVPPTNAYKLYRGLQDRGIPSKLIIYKGFGHGINKPKERLAVLTHNWQWFNKYIFGEEPEEEKFDEENKKEVKEKN